MGVSENPKPLKTSLYKSLKRWVKVDPKPYNPKPRKKNVFELFRQGEVVATVEEDGKQVQLLAPAGSGSGVQGF